MKFKFYLAAVLAIFLCVAYWFIAHSYVFVRLTAVLGFMVAITFVIVVLVFFGRLFR